MTWAAPGYGEVRELGAGASGRVVLARHEATGTLVAIKYLSAEFVRDAGFRARFAQEAGLLGEISSPHVARLYEYLEDEDGAAIVMQAVQGVTLRDLIARGGPTGPEAALVVLKGSLLGLAAAHRLGVVHRDYKPANVLVGTEGSSALVDFGIALRSGAAAIVSGTPQYMAPEQWEGRPATPQTDIYAATATVVECLTGAPPFTAADVRALALAHRNAPLDLDALPGPVRRLVGSGMAKDPADRPGTAEAFVAALDEAARAAHGPGWEVEGRLHLAARVAALASLLPLDRTDASATTTATGGIREVAMSSPLDPGARWARRGRLALAGALVTVLVAAGSLLTTSGGPDPANTVTLASTTGGDLPEQGPAAPAAPEPPAPGPVPRDDVGGGGAVTPPEVPAEAPVRVTGVEFAELTGEGGDLAGTVRVRTSGPGRVEVGFVYADGERSARSLSGSTSYDVPFTHTFAAGSAVCQVRITTTPAGPGGSVVGDRPCGPTAEPAPQPATVTALNFAAVDYSEDGGVSGKLVVEADGPGPVTVRLDLGKRAETLSFDGGTRYVHRFHHPPVPCGKAFGFAASAPGGRAGIDGNLPPRPCEPEVEPVEPGVPAQPQQVAPPSEPPGPTEIGEPG